MLFTIEIVAVVVVAVVVVAVGVAVVDVGSRTASTATNLAKYTECLIVNFEFVPQEVQERISNIVFNR